MRLDPQLASVLAELQAPGAKGFEDMTPAEAREAVMSLRAYQATPPAMAAVREEVLSARGDVHLRIYRPVDVSQRAPVVLFFHGGGWTVGNIDFADWPVRGLSAASRAIWVSASYRLAPEHPYPAALEDVWAALEWVAERASSLGGDPARLVVVGESSGANLAAALALLARDRKGPRLAHQYLLFPPLGLDLDTASYQRYGEGFLLTRSAMRWFWTNYLGDDLDGAPELAVPLRASHLAGVAPATIVVAQCDPLRDDGVAYHRRLEEAQVPVSLIEWDGLTHGAFQMTGAVDRARDLMHVLGKRIGAIPPSVEA